ncbi:MAG: hypothetical protein BJG00_008840 [Limnothrix sp. CACIAM 69d]|nr:MAG: hypothetical protein BJG00_008840 [Limnothrix sp. CACIAM 69d]
MTQRIKVAVLLVALASLSSINRLKDGRFQVLAVIHRRSQLISVDAISMRLQATWDRSSELI